MHNVSFNGVETSIVKISNEYRDTVVTPVHSDSGPTELTKVEGQFSRTYNTYISSISSDTAEYVNALGYNVLCQRVIPWKKKLNKSFSFNSNYYKLDESSPLIMLKSALNTISNDFNLNYILSESDTLEYTKDVLNNIITYFNFILDLLVSNSTLLDSINKYNELIVLMNKSDSTNIFSIVFDGDLEDCTYIKITDQSEYPNDIFIWTNLGNYKSIPGSFGTYNEVIEEKTLNDQVRHLAKALSKYKFSCSVEYNKLTISTNYKCRLEYGRLYQDIHYAGIRFFNRAGIFSAVNGVVTESNNNYVVILSEGKEYYIANQSTDEYDSVVTVGQIVKVNSPIYINFNYSYPDSLKTYVDRDSYDNYKLESLAKSNRTYSIKIRLDRFIQGLSDKYMYPLNVEENGYILVNNGIYNILIWYAYFDEANDYGIITKIESGALQLAKVYSLRKVSSDNTEYAYAIKIKSKSEFILSRQVGVDELEDTIAVCSNYNEENRSGSFEFEYGGNNISIQFTVEYQGKDKGLIKISEVIDKANYFGIVTGDIFDVLKYTYIISRRESFTYNGNVGDFIEVGDKLFGPELPVIKSLDINPDYWYINEFRETHQDEAISNEDLINLQIERLLSVLNLIGFVVDYDRDNKIITVSSYDSLRIVDISSIFSTFDNPNGSYDILCQIDDEYKCLDITSKLPTHNNEIELEFNNNDIADYELLVRKLNKDNEVIQKEKFLVSLNSESPYFIDNVLSIKSNIVRSTTYFNGFIRPGKYRLNRVEEYFPNYEDTLCSIINCNMLSRRFEVFMDGGCLVPGIQNFVGYMLNDSDKLELFTVVDINNFDYKSIVRFNNTAYSYPYITINEKVYPAYVAFLETAIKNLDYTGEVHIDKLNTYPTNYQIRSLMSIYYDNYRYVISHNYIKSKYGAILPEIALVHARIINILKYDINYNTYKFDILTQLNSNISTIMGISNQVLNDLRIESIRVEDRYCYIDLVTEYLIYKGDPVTINVKLNINI